uniref:Uncharacterized LOC100185416 n=1 Tax=Ciona intestinalis TaxID=7719 RepID=F6QS40_CIOIN|nr:uncharacterized protein LOC100185416 [Ciona intestinalis]|eukprot:XP_002126823.1 uncharacterized protein LOC100185416 [Ciona intestinalis]
MATLCVKRRKILYVKGYGGFFGSINSQSNQNEGKVRTAFKDWFNVSDEDIIIQSNRGQIRLAFRRASLTVPDKMIVDLRKHINEAMDLCDCDKIHLIIIAHSHGAKCIMDTFHNLGVPPIQVTKIYQSTAIITFGPTDLVTKSTAKVTGNFYFKNDSMVDQFRKKWTTHDCNVTQLGEFKRLTEDTFECSCCHHRTPEADAQHEEEGTIRTPCEMVPNAVNAPVQKVAAVGAAGIAVAAVVGTAVGAAAGPGTAVALVVGSLVNAVRKEYRNIKAHFMGDYISCRSLQFKIRQMFGL